MIPKHSLSIGRRAALVILTISLVFVELSFAQCPYTSLTSEGTRLYLYFASSSDATFPEYDPDATTSPLQPFDVADLDSGIGTTAELRDRIIELVKEDYCEFDVEVNSSTSAPTTTGSRWQIVGIGSDSQTVSGGNLFGIAQNVDLNDSDAQDYARVYAQSFKDAYGGAGDALNGTNSTLERWATAIGHTVSHEAGHNFGLSHSDSAARTGEDEQNWHMMATGSTGLTGEERASRNRHFGDAEYEILGHNIGLRIKTLTNWDFINPNAEDASQLVVTLLSSASSLTLNWFWNGTTSPWGSPTVATAGTQSFHGTTYNKFNLTFSVPKAWSGGADGIVPGGTEFHVGATFAESDPIIVYETRLKDSGGSNLNLHPRLVGFDAGVADLSSGDFNLTAFNPDPAVQLLIEDLHLVYLPRMASIASMIVGAELRDIHNNPIQPRAPSRSFEAQRQLELKGEATKIRLASLNDRRAIDIFYDDKGCKRGYKPGPEKQGSATPGPTTPTPPGPGDTSTGEIEYCPHGWALSLFPSTYVYLTATIVEPNAKYWDKAQAKYINGPLRSKVFYQFSGIVPDFNKNGIDDLIDIRSNTSIDKNKNGIVDEAERLASDHGWMIGWWWWVLTLLIIILLLWILLRFRKPVT
jgi:hypothetical protein